MKKLLFLMLLPSASFAQTVQKDFTLKGELQGLSTAEWAFLSYHDGNERRTDSIQVKNNAFQFKGKIAEPVAASLTVRFAQQPGQERAIRKSLQLFMEPAQMNLIAKDSLKVSSVTGSAGHADFVSLMQKSQAYGKQLNELYVEYEKFNKAGDKEGTGKVEASIEAVSKEMNEKVYGDFIRNQKSSPVAVFALQQYAGWDIQPELVEPLFKGLPAAYQQWPSAVAFKDRMEIAKKTAIGQPAMDFTQNDTLGKAVSLSSFKGKYVLVDFWASWCGPCRRENPNVVKAFNTYKDRNFTVLGVSLDRPEAKDKWIAAIHKDGLTWTQVSDLKYWDNAVAKQYGIRAIPQNLLIDPQGKIIAKNISGENLTKKLEEVLPK